MVTATATWIEVRCGNVRNGRVCGHLIAKVDADKYVSGSVELECRRCGDVKKC